MCKIYTIFIKGWSKGSYDVNISSMSDSQFVETVKPSLFGQSSVERLVWYISVLVRLCALKLNSLLL